MPPYMCSFCDFSTNLKSNYTRHLKTKKHEQNEKAYRNEIEKKNENPSQTLTNPHKKNEIPHKSSQILTKKNDCAYCGKLFKRADNLRRHMNHYCKHVSTNTEDIYKQLYIDSKKELEIERQEFKKQIELLLTKVGNTTITNNIQLNSYGSEDLTHITDTLKTQLVKMPYKMIPKMIEAVHFDETKPENKNIILSNSRDNKIKVFSNNKWVYRDKEETITDLIDGKYFILDSHFNHVFNKIPESAMKSYEKFREYYDNCHGQLHHTIKKDCELLLLNNR